MIKTSLLSGSNLNRNNPEQQKLGGNSTYQLWIPLVHDVREASLEVRTGGLGPAKHALTNKPLQRHLATKPWSLSGPLILWTIFLTHE